MQNLEDMEFYPAALTIAGSDSGGGAGIQADLRTFNAFGIYGCSAITAVTAQNPNEVRQVEALPAEIVRSQIDCVLDAIPVRIAKTGMLADCEIVETVADTIRERRLPTVVDPVMVSTSGARLLKQDAVTVLLEKLFPLAAWITPNIPEAELILGRKLDGRKALADAARTCYDRWGCGVILKSGHALNGKTATDLICCDGKVYTLSSPTVRIAEKTAHGTGCTLSSALAAGLAFGMNWDQAVSEAKSFVYGSLCEAVNLSGGLSQMYPPSEDSLNRIRLEVWKDK